MCNNFDFHTKSFMKFFLTVTLMGVLYGVAGTLGIEQAVVTPSPRTVVAGDKYSLVGVLQPINIMKAGRYSVVGSPVADQPTVPKVPHMSITSQPDGSLSINWEASSLLPFMAPQFSDGVTNQIWAFSKFQMTPSGGRMTVNSNLIKQSQFFRLANP
jgi:hypothetical protein